MHLAGVSHRTATEPEKSLFGGAVIWQQDLLHSTNTEYTHKNACMMCVWWAVSNLNFSVEKRQNKPDCARVRSKLRVQAECWTITTSYVITTDKQKFLMIWKVNLVFYNSESFHSLKAGILFGGGSSSGFSNALPRLQWSATKSSTRCVCVCLCLFNHFVVFNSAVSSHCKKIFKNF